MTSSRRLVVTATAALLAGVPASVAVAAAARVHHGGGLDSTALSACVSGAVGAQRSATFSAQMDAVPGTRLMAVSFDLFERAGATSPYTAVAAPGFGVWQTSNPGIGSFTANENVVDLPAAGDFRAIVHFRWLGRRGRVIRRDVRITPACSITAPQPDLSITRITHAPGSPARTTELFNVTVRNRGGAAAGPFAVALSDASATLPEQTVPGLAPATATTLQFSGPRCTAGNTITAQLDPAGAISEPADPARTVTIACTAPTGATGAT